MSEDYAKYIKRFRRLCAGLKRLQQDMQDDGIEDAAFYFDDDNFNLMVGPTHNHGDGQARRDNSIDSVMLPNSGGGGW